ncbi:hypothetical protein [Dyella mobilis]|uniref:DUF4124 domain-containing protein n=1 Tax=Dyella mobilis TaxID=1849582 RepID=A0ABS2K9X1_9GAMM|nr:hypothetical protein [Dyella mobilis]MBM7127986.1 hypothetical protein [Dyella mobilis]
MDIRHLSAWAIAVALLAPCLAVAQTTNPPTAAKGVVYHCVRPDGSIEYTTVPSVGCTVLFTFVPAEWRVIASGGRGTSEWKVYVNEYWRNKHAEHAGSTIWLFASPRERSLTGETYKALAEHVSVECGSARLTLDHRTYFKDKPGGLALTPDDSTQTIVAPAGSPAAAIVREFCS